MAKRVPAGGRYAFVDVFVHECVCLHVNILLYTSMSHIPSCLHVHDTYAHAKLQHVGGGERDSKRGQGRGWKQHMTQQTSEETGKGHSPSALLATAMVQRISGGRVHARSRTSPCTTMSSSKCCSTLRIAQCLHASAVSAHVATAGMRTCDHVQA